MKTRNKIPFIVSALIASLNMMPVGRAAAQTFTNLYSFTALIPPGNSDGAHPRSGLTLSGNTLYGTASAGGTSDAGTVFKINADGTGFTNLHSFTNGDDGANPYGALVLLGNTLYGTANAGGAAARGTVFKVNTDGTAFTTLYDFTNGSDGAIPEGLVLSGGTLYGTASVGASAGKGTVFKVNTDGTGFATLCGFAGSTAGSGPDGLVVSGDTLYGTTLSGGTGHGGTVFALGTNGTGFTNLYNFAGVTNGVGPGGLILSGNALYGTAIKGGASNTGAIFKVNTDGTGFTVLYSFAANSHAGFTNTGGVNPEPGLALSGDTLYGTTLSGGTGRLGTVFALGTNGTGFTAVHSFAAGSNGALPAAGLTISGNTLYGTATDAGGSGNGTVFRVNTDGSGFTNLYSFTAYAAVAPTNSDGGTPTAGLAVSGHALYGAASAGGTSGVGTLFKVNADGSGFEPLYGFTNGFDGATPSAGLTISGQTLYGTASGGGSWSGGTVFSVNSDGTGFTTLYGFTNGDDGSAPDSGLILSGMTLFGVASGGGAGASGTVFSVMTNGTAFRTFYSFTNGSDGASPLGEPLLSGNTLYGTANGGGAAGSGTVFKVNTNGTGFATLHTFSALFTNTNGVYTNGDGSSPMDGLILSGNTLYGTAMDGGDSGNGTVFRVNTDGTAFTNLHSFTALDAATATTNTDGANPQAGLVLSGNTLYGAAAAGGGLGNGTVFAVNTDGTGFTTLYTFTNGDDGAAPDGGLILLGNTLYGTAAGGGSGGGALFNLALPSVPVPQGSLQVTIAPPGAVAAGAQWQADGNGTNENSGATENLPAGSNTVSFNAAYGWNPPASYRVNITNNHTTVITGVYTLQTGALQVTLTPAAAATHGAQWRVDGGAYHNSGVTVGNLLVLSNHLVSFKPVAGFATPATQSVTISNDLTNPCLGAYLDTNRPSVTIVSPLATFVASNAALTVTATATDNVAVSNVFIQLNTSGWNPAQPPNNGPDWTAPVTLVPGTNTVFACAEDTSGNLSVTNHVTFVYNRYLLAQGAYNGLFSVTNASREQTNSGGLAFNLTSTGAFSGRLLLATNTNTLSGKFDLTGAFHTNFARSSLSANLQLDFDHQIVGGSVTDGSFHATVAGYLRVAGASYIATNYKGSYTLIVPGVSDPALGPFGTGYGTVTVDASGDVALTGSLADGTPISQSSALSQEGYWPMYVPLDGGKASLWGWNQFSNRAIVSVPFASWIRPATATANPVNGSGFTNQQAAILGSSYVATQTPPLALTNGVVRLAGGGLPASITNFITLARSGVITTNHDVVNTNKLTLHITSSSGLISGSFANPTNPAQTIKVNGVLMQNQTNAEGYFTNAGQSGTFELAPQ